MLSQHAGSPGYLEGVRAGIRFGSRIGSKEYVLNNAGALPNHADTVSALQHRTVSEQRTSKTLRARLQTILIFGFNFSLKKWCGAKDENIVEEIARFENMILEEGARLKERGEKGLEILPGAQKLLDSVCGYCVMLCMG